MSTRRNICLTEGNWVPLGFLDWKWIVLTDWRRFNQCTLVMNICQRISTLHTSLSPQTISPMSRLQLPSKLPHLIPFVSLCFVLFLFCLCCFVSVLFMLFCICFVYVVLYLFCLCCFVSVLFMLFCICFVSVLFMLFCICFVSVLFMLFCLCFVYVVLFLFCFSERSERRLELIFEDFSGDKIIKRFTCFVEKLKEHFDTFEVKMKDASGKHLQTRLAGRSNIVTMMAFWQDVTNNWLLVTWNWWTIGLN